MRLNILRCVYIFSVVMLTCKSSLVSHSAGCCVGMVACVAWLYVCFAVCVLLLLCVAVIVMSSA